jgi:competence protein ComEC
MYVGAGRLAANGGGHWLAAAGRAQWAITVGLIPLMLALFQQFSLVSPLANALAIPVVGMVVVPLALALLVVPWDGILLGAHQLFALTVLALEWLNALPAAHRRTPPATWRRASSLQRCCWRRAVLLGMICRCSSSCPRARSPGAV